MLITEDKRLLRDGPEFWVHRKSEKPWHYCKYCYHDVPTFLLSEGLYGSVDTISILRCCWECGAGLESIKELDVAEMRRIIERASGAA